MILRAICLGVSVQYTADSSTEADIFSVPDSDGENLLQASVLRDVAWRGEVQTRVFGVSTRVQACKYACVYTCTDVCKSMYPLLPHVCVCVCLLRRRACYL